MSEPLIADSVERLFAAEVDNGVRERAEGDAFDTRLWTRVVEAGYPAMLATEAAGGLAHSWSEAYPVLRGIGWHQAPLPLAETMVAAQLASSVGLAVPEGVPLTLVEEGQGSEIEAWPEGEGLLLTGIARHVPWARHSQAALVSLAAPGGARLAWLELRAPGVTLQTHANVAGLPSDTLQLDRVRCQAAPAPRWPRPVWTLGALARCAMLVGALESALEQAVRYARERVQFGRPLAGNQAIQHMLALVAGDVAAARMATLVAVADAPDAANLNDAVEAGKVPMATQALAFGTAVAKVRCGEAATRAAAIVHQVHGAIGFTQEHRLHFATRRLWAWREEFGTDAQWAAELGRAAIGAGAAGFWPALTGKGLAVAPG